MESGPDLPGATGDVVHDVVLADGEVIEVLGANAYVQEGPLTTFFHSGRSRAAIDSWSERIASFKTTEIRRIIRRVPSPLRAVQADSLDTLASLTAG
ncbi:MAG TPA: hypothetical protein VFE55_15010 [Acidimicrobiia bacterium]|nr:hypothetical protein [Acidimicrobiia bacterium]